MRGQSMLFKKNKTNEMQSDDHSWSLVSAGAVPDVVTMMQK
jgi:hypothetical protein